MFGRIKNLLPFNLGAPACTGGDEDPAQPAICKQTGCTADLADVDAEIRPDGADSDDMSGEYQDHNDCGEYDAMTNECQSAKTILDESQDFQVDLTFPSIAVAKLKASAYCGCPVTQRSAKKQAYVYLECFRAGKAKVIATAEKQRRLHTKKCGCPFKATLKRIDSGFKVTFDMKLLKGDTLNGIYQLISLISEHNHELYTQDELQLLPQNRFIPSEIEAKIISLFKKGNLTIEQIMSLIESEHFPDVKVTWTKRDVQNLTQKVCDRNKEASDFIRLLELKREKDNWSVRTYMNPATLRLERVFWMSSTGKDLLRQFDDVVEGDATYQTNRFGMPLVLFTVADSNGITGLVGGALISDETYDSYKWTLDQLKDFGQTEPSVLFTDGDVEFAKAIAQVFPSTTHLLCRWHISQNIIKKLSGELRKDLNTFVDDFWRVGSIEEMPDFEREWALMKDKWISKPLTHSYIDVLYAKRAKWVFAITHTNFVAGISSTQRQESVNNQTKSGLITNSVLSQLVNCFDRLDASVAQKITMASLNTKLVVASTSDPMIADALAVLTKYAGEILKEESVLSLSYTCTEISECDDYLVFQCSHRDHASRSRIVRFAKVGAAHDCSCRKALWHGIVCRHLLSIFRRMNLLTCPTEMFNARWTRKFTSMAFQQHAAIEKVLGNVEFVGAECSGSQEITERASMLSVLAKDIIGRCVYEDSHYELVSNNLGSLQQVLHAQMHAQQMLDEQTAATIHIRNPLKVKTKGRPKQKRTREKSVAELQRQKAKKKHVNGSAA